MDYLDEFFSYMCNGAAEYFRTGELPESKSMIEEKKTLLEENDIFGEFIGDYCEVNIDQAYPSTRLQEDIKKYMGVQLSCNAIAIGMRRKGFTNDKIRNGGPQFRGYRGIGPKYV